MKFVCLAEHKLNCPIHLNGERQAKTKSIREMRKWISLLPKLHLTLISHCPLSACLVSINKWKICATFKGIFLFHSLQLFSPSGFFYLFIFGLCLDKYLLPHTAGCVVKKKARRSLFMAPFSTLLKLYSASSISIKKKEQANGAAKGLFLVWCTWDNVGIINHSQNRRESL